MRSSWIIRVGPSLMTSVIILREHKGGGGDTEEKSHVNTEAETGVMHTGDCLVSFLTGSQYPHVEISLPLFNIYHFLLNSQKSLYFFWILKTFQFSTFRFS